MEWEYPEGVNVLSEYWLETDSPRVVAIMEAESTAPVRGDKDALGDLFDIEVFPAMTGEQGMEVLRQAIPVCVGPLREGRARGPAPFFLPPFVPHSIARVRRPHRRSRGGRSAIR